MDGPRIKIHIRASSLLLRIQLLLHLLVFAAVLLCGLDIRLRLLLSLLPLASLACEIKRHRDRVAHGEIVLGCGDAGWWLVEKGHCMAVQLRGDSRLLGKLLVLRLQYPERRLPRTLLLLADSADAAQQRRLRVWLRLRPQLVSAPPSTTTTEPLM